MMLGRHPVLFLLLDFSASLVSPFASLSPTVKPAAAVSIIRFRGTPLGCSFCPELLSAGRVLDSHWYMQKALRHTKKRPLQLVCPALPSCGTVLSRAAPWAAGGGVESCTKYFRTVWGALERKRCYARSGRIPRQSSSKGGSVRDTPLPYGIDPCDA